MRNVKEQILAAIIIVALLTIAHTAWAEIIPGQSVGKLVVESASGEEVNLGDYGKPFILAFFVPNKEEDTKQMKALKEILVKKKHNKYTVFAITRGKNDAEKAVAVNFMKQNGLDFELLFDSRAKAARKFENRVFPTFYVFDERGIMKAASLNTVTEPNRRLTFEDFLDYVTEGREIPFVDFIPYPPENRRSKTAHGLLGKTAPDFTLPDTYGRMHALSDYRGEKNVILIFWSTTCPHCLKELPLVQSFYLTHRLKDNFEVLAVTTVKGESGLKKLKSLIKKNMFTFITLNDEQNVSEMYGVRYVPMAFFINKDGVIVDYLSGENKYFGQVYNSIFADPNRLGEKKK